jgi:hypothetical protein
MNAMPQRRALLNHEDDSTYYADDDVIDDPLTEENVEYELSRAFLRLYQRDATLRCIDLYDITEENAISILSVMKQSSSSSSTGEQEDTDQLQELCLTYSNLSMNIIPVLSIGTNLRILDLGGNQLGDAGVEALMNALVGDGSTTTTISSSCSLKFLNLSDNQIGTDGVCAIADANAIIGLQSLCLCQNPNIGKDHTTTLAGEALLQLADTLQVIFCWDNAYSYAVKDMLQNSSHPKLYWVRPYHWESELQRARDKALRHAMPTIEQVQLQQAEDRMVDPDHYVSSLLRSTNQVFRAARQHLLDNFHPAMLDPTMLHRRPQQQQVRHVPEQQESSPTTVVNTTSNTTTTRGKIMTLAEKRQAQESKAEVKARLRRRREEIANGKVVVASSAEPAATTTTDARVIRTTTIIDGIPVTFLSTAPPLSEQATTTTKKKKEYGTSVRRWKPSHPTDPPANAATNGETRSNNNRRDNNGSSDDDDYGYDHDGRQQHHHLLPPQELPANYEETRRANRRLNARRQKMIQHKLSTVAADTQFATAKARLEILERHQELAHQYI